MMKKLLIVSVSLLCVAGFISMAWAHGPSGSGFGYRSYGHSKPHFSRPSHSRVHQRHNKHYRHQRHKQHYRHPRHNKHYRHQRHFRYHRPYYGPLVRYYDYGYEDSSPPREELPQVPRHTPSSRIYFSNNPEPWFLYGKGKEFRQMGLIPPLPQTSQELK